MDGFILSLRFFYSSNISAMKKRLLLKSGKAIIFWKIHRRTYKIVNREKKTHQVFDCCCYSYCLDFTETEIDFDQESGLSERDIHSSSKASCHLRRPIVNTDTNTKKNNFCQTILFLGKLPRPDNVSNCLHFWLMKMMAGSSRVIKIRGRLTFIPP